MSNRVRERGNVEELRFVPRSWQYLISAKLVLCSHAGKRGRNANVLRAGGITAKLTVPSMGRSLRSIPVTLDVSVSHVIPLHAQATSILMSGWVGSIARMRGVSSAEAGHDVITTHKQHTVTMENIYFFF